MLCMCMLVYVLHNCLCVDHHTYIVIPLCAGVRSSDPVLWALLRGAPVWASALTAWLAELWSRTWWEQKRVQQQEHLSALPLALLPVFQELSHFPLPILHFWTTRPAYWKVSNVLHIHDFCWSLLDNFVYRWFILSLAGKLLKFLLFTGTSLTSCTMCHFPRLRDHAS